MTLLQPKLCALTLADERNDLLQLLPVVVPPLDLRLPVARDEQRACLPVHPVRDRAAQGVSDLSPRERAGENPLPKAQRPKARDEGLALFLQFF